jgi:hypothetical protein
LPHRHISERCFCCFWFTATAHSWIDPVYEVILALVRNVRNGSFASILARPLHVRSEDNPGNAGCPVLLVEGIGLEMAQGAQTEARMIAAAAAGSVHTPK